MEEEQSVDRRLAAIESRMTSVETRLAAGDERMAALEHSQHGMQQELAENTRITQACRDAVDASRSTLARIESAFERADRAFGYLEKTGNAVGWMTRKALSLAVAVATIAGGVAALLHYLRGGGGAP